MMPARLPSPVLIGVLAVVTVVAACRAPAIGQAGSASVAGRTAASARGTASGPSSVALRFTPPGLARATKTIVSAAQNYRLRIHEDAGGAPGAQLADLIGPITPGVENTITVDGLPAEKLLDFKLEVKDAGSAIVGQGLAQATLSSQEAANSIPMTMYAEMPGMPGAANGDNGSVSATYTGIGTGDSRTVSARLNLAAGVEYQIQALVTGSSCTPDFSTFAGAETAVLPGTSTVNTSWTFPVTGGGGYYDVRTAFSNCAGNPTYTVKALRQATGFTSLGGFGPTGRNMSYLRAGACAVASGSYAFVSGGKSDTYGAERVDTDSAPVSSGGALGAFSIATFPYWLAGHGCAVVRNYFYVVGGVNGSNTKLTIYRATIQSNGAISSWTELTQRLEYERSEFPLVRIKNYLYALGGHYFAGGDYKGVQRATINADSTITSFTTVTDMRIRRSGHTAEVIGNYLYVFGGISNIPLTATVERAPINEDGTLGLFEDWPASTMTSPRGFHRSALVGSTVYVFGGTNGSGRPLTVDYATADGNGNLGAFTTHPTLLLTTGRESAASVVVNGKLFVFGGYNGAFLKSVEEAPLQ